MFIPERVIFEKDSLDYPLGEKLYNDFKSKDKIEILVSSINKVKSNIPGDNLKERYKEGKKTLVVGVKKSLKFQSCKPSAHYQLPLVSGCIGQCEYCYLNTQLGDKPFVRVHVNIAAILNQANKYIMEGVYHPTIFEGAATSDPIPVEGYTQALQRAITFFGETKEGRFRFVTKYNDVDSLLDLPHNNHTEIRFSLNSSRIIKEYEH
ncbi:MAG TPA: spore photoproduct lyase, partial [Clostridium sp.]